MTHIINPRVGVDKTAHIAVLKVDHTHYYCLPIMRLVIAKTTSIKQISYMITSCNSGRFLVQKLMKLKKFCNIGRFLTSIT